MTSIKSIIALVLLCVMTARTGASEVTLTTSNPPGTPLLVPAGTAQSAPMLLKVIADAVPPTPGPADRMLAWQFQITIVADSGATGTVTFNNPTSATPANPPNYIFASSAGILATKSGGNTVLDANDFDDAPAGTVVPAGAGANLLEVDFTSSSDASGTFGIFANAGAATTVWTDGTPASREYANVPFAGGMVRIGEVVIPEPAGMGLLMIGGMLLARRRRGSVG